MDIAGLVRAARTESGLSQKALAKRIGIDPSVLSRVEAGTRLPSLPMLDRVLAACGRDAQWRLVHRHADLDEVLDRLAREPVEERLLSLSSRIGGLVRDLAPLGVLVGGAWAAAVHALPREHDRGRLWLPGDADTTTAAIGLLRRYLVNLVEDGRPVGASYDPKMLQRNPDRTWLLHGVQFRLTVLDEDADGWPVEVRVPGETGPVRVVAPADLTDADGVRPEVLARWLERRSGSGNGQRSQRKQHDDDREHGG
jgi:transcriptional regulator with XRE-family HTH domain